MKKFIPLVLLALLMSIYSIAQPVRTTWPMINGDPAHTSNAKIDITFPLTAMNLSQFDYNSADGMAVSEDKIFITDARDSNLIHAVDRLTGDLLWTFGLPGTAGGMEFNPAVAHGVVLAGGQHGEGLYGLDVNNGNVLWLLPVGSLYARGPAIFDSLVYVPAGTGLICLNIQTGIPLWTHDGFVPQVSPVLDSQNVYFNADGVIYNKNRLTGQEVWSTSAVSNSHFTSFALDDVFLFVGFEKAISALSVSSGDLAWQFTLDSDEKVMDYPGSFALTENYLLIKTQIQGASLNHYRVIEKATGHEVTRYNGGGFGYGAPTIINDYVVDCSGGRILFLELMSGDTAYMMTNIPFGGYPHQLVAVKDKIFLAASGPYLITLQSTPSGVQQLSSGLGLGLAPNPAANEVTMFLTLGKSSRLDVRVLGMNGKTLLHRKPGFFTAGEHQLELDLGGLTSGLYFVEIQSAQGTETKKLIVQ